MPLSRVCPYMMASAVNVFGFLCWPSGFSSPIFEFYALNQSTNVVPLNETDTYLGDWIGTVQGVVRVTRATTSVLFWRRSTLTGNAGGVRLTNDEEDGSIAHVLRALQARGLSPRAVQGLLRPVHAAVPQQHTVNRPFVCKCLEVAGE